MSDKQILPQQSSADNQGKNFNYYITRFFLNNTRLTILSFILLIIVGIVATFSTKTTGFPNPEVGISIVQTVYPGASSETIVKDISQPLEGAIKDVEGVKNYTSFSRNSVSIISVTLDENSNFDTVRNKLDSAVKGVSLPEGAESPKLTKPEVGGPSLVFSVAGNDLDEVYDAYTQAVADLNQLPETSSVEPIVDLKKQAVIKLDLEKVRDSGITIDQIQSQISSIGESIPVTSETSIDQTNYTINTSVSGSSLEDIENLEFTPLRSQSGRPSTQPTAPSQPVKLAELSTTDIEYNYIDGDRTSLGIRGQDQEKILPAAVFSVKAAEGTDIAVYTSTISDQFNSYENVKYLRVKDNSDISGNEVLLVENYSVNDQNQEQVDEVVGGLIGGELDFIDGPASNVGWLLGGIQLVFLVMLAFVSWRAAIIAAVSIPLSLMFSTIYLFLVGESLNTLVLFSLVLVIGLVVDPVLVILEAIQRKVDTGLKGKDAVLEAVKDVGNGLFLATVTNIIVFSPFGVISGILGQIFGYIPLTIIPATIGSYVIPLVFLAWMGGLILKPSKNKTASEEGNLWGVAKWLISLNRSILEGSRILRLIIVIVALIIPIGVGGYYFSTGQMTAAQFTSTDNGNNLSIGGSFLPGTTKGDREQALKDLTQLVIENENVLQVYPFDVSDTLTLNVELKDAQERDIKSSEIVEDLNAKIQEQFVQEESKPKFFDLRVGVEQNGPPSGAYQVSIAVKTDDLNKLELASVEVGKVAQTVCFTDDRRVVIDDNCDGERIVERIDDGYTGKQSKVIEVLIDRQKLQEAQLVVPNAPLSALVNQTLRQLFNINDSKPLITLIENGDELEVVLDKNSPDPKILEEIENTIITSLAGQQIKLSDVAQINERVAKSSIQRVKGQTTGIVQVGLKEGFDDESISPLVNQAILDHFDDSKLAELGLEEGSIEEYSEGGTAANARSFQELLIALVLAVFLTYIVLSLFFQSFTMPLVVLYTIPLTFIGVFPALVYLGTGEFGFFEIIGMIILIGIVENVAIFLIDSARQKISYEGWSEKQAISFASGVRMRPVLMTQFTAIASLAPLAVLSPFYRSIALVIMFGLISSGFLSLVTTPILFVFFKWLSRQYRALKWYNKILFFPLFVIYIIVLAIKDRPQKSNKKVNIDVIQNK
ncbi:MAG: efflux RND transporter permease subunit [Patescibacteria group bacterium]